MARQPTSTSRAPTDPNKLEIRVFERHDGKWKVAYLSYLLAGNPEKKPAR
jgi:hypothetical protein